MIAAFHASYYILDVPLFKRPPLTLLQAKHKVMDLFARRDHTLKEIEKKLKDRCEPGTLKELLTWVAEQTWLPTEAHVQEQMVRALGRRKKGQNYINQKLKAMGLNSIKILPEIELEKALEALQLKWNPEDLVISDFASKQKQKAKVIRFLNGRGFDLSIASQAYKIYFNTNKAEIYDNDEEF